MPALSHNLSTLPPGTGFCRLHVRAIKQESEDVRSFELGTEDGTSLPESIPGQHISVKLYTAASSPPITRMYSLCRRTVSPTYRIGVEREPMGVASTYLHQCLQAGDLLEVSAPRGTFVLVEGSIPLILLGAGVGITPMLAKLQSAVSNLSRMPREIWWIHSAHKLHSLSIREGSVRP
jgi:ferredoxin-NADP reductase